MKNIKNEIWVLADNRPGNYSQAIALAAEIAALQSCEFRIINVEYNLFSHLPNLILRESAMGISRQTQEKIAQLNFFPSLIISAGRRCAPLALYLKKLSENCTKIAQIMNPEIAHAKFDFIILPKHDQLNAAENIIKTVGALAKTNDVAIKIEREKFATTLGKIPQTKIALLIGGSSKNSQFEKSSAIKLAQQVAKIAKNMHATLLVLNSRRTGEKLTEAIKSTLASLNCDYQFFDWQKIKQNENPYLAIIGYADFFIATGDSVAMISEICATGKPVYIFDEKSLSAPKHRRFHQNLLQENCAKKLDEKACTLDNFAAKKLSETKRVAAIITQKE